MSRSTDFKKEMAELQGTLATADLRDAIERASQSKDMHYLLVKVLQPIKIKMDANKNHKRPHVHIDYGNNYHAASYAIDTGRRIVGDSRYDHEVHDWIIEHRPKLLRAWELMQAGKDARPIGKAVYKVNSARKYISNVKTSDQSATILVVQLQ